MLFTTIGAIGILLICFGILTKKPKRENIYHILGGIALIVYSIYIQNTIFIILQGIFIIAAIYDLLKINENLRRQRATSIK